jgi:Fe-S cluster assembly protein SufD
MSTVAIKHETAGDRAISHYVDALRSTRARLPGSGIPWMQRLRDRAAARLTEHGFPTTRWEDWKYTDTQPLQKRAFNPVVKDANAVAEQVIEPYQQAIEPYQLDELKTHRLVFVDGHYAPALSQVGAASEGVIIEPFAQALPRHVDLIEPHLARYADMNANPFVALNTMLMSDGLFLYLPAGTAIETPIHLLYLSTVDGGTSQLRNLVIAGESAEATLIEHYVGAAEIASWANAVTEIALAENAGLEHYKLNEDGDKAFHVATVEVRQARDSRYTSHNACISGRLVRKDINVRLEGESAACALNGLYVLKGRQHVDNHTRIDHVQPRAVSRELYKGVLDGWSRGVFNGKVIVHKDAQLTDSNQANHNLLLSPNAEADPKPQLEIFADDVKCTHGATVGRLDENALYYLRSRGVPASEARALLTFAFANDVIGHMRLEPIRARLENIIRTRLPSGEML